LSADTAFMISGAAPKNCSLCFIVNTFHACLVELDFCGR
jgi:hypothetical protein